MSRSNRPHVGDLATVPGSPGGEPLRDTPGSLRAMALWLCSDLEMLVMTSGGRERTAEEFGELFAAAGLRLTRVVPTAGAAFVLEAARTAGG